MHSASNIFELYLSHRLFPRKKNNVYTQILNFINIENTFIKILNIYIHRYNNF